MNDAASAPAAEKPVRRFTRGRLVGLALSIAIIAYAADQLTKMWVENNMYEGQVIPVVPPLLNWYFIRNPGAAFSIGTEYTWVFALLMAFVFVLVLFLLRKLGSLWWAVALGGLLGGVAGNLTDRLFRPPAFLHGHVVDFISVPNFAIFNIADSFIVCSMIGICLLMFVGRKIDGTKEADSSKDVKADTGEADKAS